jgi:asparagine synthase (glutamine-hydrolysing)
MCGIAGWVESAASRAASLEEEALVPMLEALTRRNPDGSELMALVERRGGRRAVMGAALCDRASGISVALDGTIANAEELRADLARRGFPFKGAGAAELLLRAYQRWDRDVAKHLRGALALAVWDSRRERLLLARDRFGEKPLYLSEAKGALFFASEAKALLSLPGARVEADPEAMRDYLAYRFVPGGRTLFAGIRQLAPGTSALWEFGRLRETPYWTPPDKDPCRNAPGGDAVEGFVSSLARTMEADAGSGVFLSGGIDSAAIVAVLSAGGAVKTFSLGFEGDRASELPQAAQVAKHFGASHHEIVVKPADLAGALPRVIAARDAPLSRPSDLAVHRLAGEAARSVRTVLTGDGCDEVLGGYRSYVVERYSEGFCRSLEERRARWVDALLPEKTARESFREETDPSSSRLRRALYAAQVTQLPGQILERNERAASAAAIDIRMPFLDHRLVEYVSALPDEYRVRGLATKWILREAAKRLVPGSLATRKTGFRVPLRDWLRNELRDTLLEHLQGGASRTRGYYDAKALDRMLEQHLKGKHNHEMPLWTLLNLEIWHRQYRPA